MTAKERFIDRQIEHIRKVQDNMILLEKNLDKLPFKIKDFEILRRGMQHDLDKFSANSAPDYVRIEEYKYNQRNGIPNIEIDKDELYRCSNEHYKTQQHHDLFHEINNTEFSDLDVCEVCCDLMAVSERENGDIIKFLEEKKFPTSKVFNKRRDDILKIINLLIELKTKNKVEE